MIELYKDSISIKENGDMYELDFGSLTSEDKEKLFKEVFVDYSNVLDFIDVYKIDKKEILRFIKNNFDPEDLVEVESEVNWSF